ncbi:hypothetical protein ABZ914_03290 [Spirillospora sp. NPDC046719]
MKIIYRRGAMRANTEHLQETISGRAFLREHGLMAGAVLAALVPRTLAMLGYPDALWFGDSVPYLRSAVRMAPDTTRPSGYPLMLEALKHLRSLLGVVLVQHVMGVAIGIGVYALVWRYGRAAWPRRAWLPGLIGTAVAVPVLFDAYQIELEHLLLSDTLFAFLVVAAVVILLWQPHVTWSMGAAAGLALGLASITRSVGLPLLAVVIAWLFLRRHGIRAAVVPAIALAAGCLLPIGGYTLWYHSAHGKYAITGTSGVFLYGRTMDFADCSVIKPKPALQKLCPRRHPKNVSGAYWALWGPKTPFDHIRGGRVGGDALAGRFAVAAIEAQPLGYARVVARDTLRAFAWRRTPYPRPFTFQEYRFPAKERPLTAQERSAARSYARAGGDVRVVRPYADWARAYQRWIHLPGTLLGAMLLAAAAGIVPGRRPRRRALLPLLLSIALLVVPAATADFDYRYVLPAVPLAALAAGLAFIPRRQTGEPASSGATDRRDPDVRPDRIAETSASTQRETW